jgi:hypothetical protein
MKRSRSKVSANGVNGVHRQTMERSPLSPELRLLESLLAEPVPSKAAVARWMQKHLSKDGVLLADPWRTPDAVVLLGSFPGGWDALAAAAPRRRLEGVSKIAAKQSVGPGFLHDDLSASAEARSRLLQSFESKASAEFRPLGRRLLGAPSNEPVPKKSTPGYVDEESQSAVLRRDWTPNAATVAVDFRRYECRLGLHLAGERIAAGPFTTTIQCNGRILEPAGPWEMVCQSADEDCEYLELCIPLKGGVFLDRHLFVGRPAPIIWMVDAIRGKEPAEWRWHVRWQGAAATGLRGEATHRGQRLVGLKAQTALLPVSSPTDPFALGGMRVSVKDGAFEFSQEQRGRRIVAATAWVWSDQGPLTVNPWRRLTITQDRNPTPTEEAFAFRVASGGKNCVFFRSLEHPRRHAFLGCQTFDETIIGEFDRDGDVVPWMRIE